MARSPAFIRNSASLMIANIIAQLIFVACTPVLTRLYGPEAFGLAVSFYTTSVVLGIIISGRLDLAIVMSGNATDATRVYISALFLALTGGIVVFAIIYTADRFYVSVDTLHPILSNYLLLCVTAFAYAGQLLSLAVGNWNRKYISMSLAVILGAAVMVTYSLITGFYFEAENGLLVGRSLGIIAVSATLITLLGSAIEWRKVTLSNVGVARTIQENSRYIKLNVPYSSSEALAMEMFSIVALGFNSAKLAGYYVLVRLVLVLPVSIASMAMGQVFFREAVDLFGSEKLERMALLLWRIVSVSVTPFIVVISMFGTTIFTTIFGDEWSQVGHLAALYSITAIVISLTGFPARIYEVSRRQDLSLKLSIAYLAIKTVSLIVLFKTNVGEYLIFLCNSLIDLVYYLAYIYVLALVAGFSIRKIANSTLVPVLGTGCVTAAASLALLQTFGDTPMIAFAALFMAALVSAAGLATQFRQLSLLED